MGRLEEQDFDEKRLARRQRRKQSQLIAYIILVAIILVLVAGIGLGIHSIRTAISGSKSNTINNNEEEMASTEESSNVAIATPEESTTEPPEMTESDVLNEITGSIIGDLSLQDKIAGLFFIAPEQFTGVETVVKAGSGTQDALSTYAVGGLVYSNKNLKTESQVTEMLQATSSMSKYPLFVATREEGQEGSVISATIDGIDRVDVNNSDSAYILGSNIASAMFRYGFNFDIAPTLDITEKGFYGTDPEVVKDITSAFTRGLEEAGIAACLHDFPVSGDTKNGSVSSEINKEQLVTGIYGVYKNTFDNGNVSAVMLSNVSLPEITGDDTPASLSQTIITEELRGTLGFDGIVITGSLSESAITDKYTPDQAAIAAIKAGADMIYLPEDFNVAFNGLLSAVESGEITEDRINESLERIYRIKYADKVEHH